MTCFLLSIHISRRNLYLDSRVASAGEDSIGGGGAGFGKENEESSD